MPDWDMNGDTTATGYEAQITALRAELDQAIGVIEDRNKESASYSDALRIMRQAYVTLAFAFRRLHESGRSRDGELCLDFQKVRAQIEVHFRDHGVTL